MNFQKRLEQDTIKASVPCRVDFGGTLDISTLYLSMLHLQPSSFNIALNMRTYVTLSAWKKGQVKISSKGFDSAVFDIDKMVFTHPMGLMFATARYFNAHGVHIHIDSTSPPRSALGGSSSAAVAIAAAFFHLKGEPVNPGKIAWLVHYIEASVAGVPCGVQDHLAAAFGGVNQWVWKMGDTSPGFERQKICEMSNEADTLNSNILIAYCGIPHVSKDINGQWVRSFLAGETRHIFETICGLTKDFSLAIKEGRFGQAADLMNQETKLRCQMTPDVLDITGKKLFEKAMELNCGARFTGAGGGGCLWAVGHQSDIQKLQPLWQTILSQVKDAKILDAKIENKGIIIH